MKLYGLTPVVSSPPLAGRNPPKLKVLSRAEGQKTGIHPRSYGSTTLTILSLSKDDRGLLRRRIMAKLRIRTGFVP
jgi:hypothetical protein